MMIKFNETILQKAQDIIEERRKLREYITTCLRAGLCPQCGGSVVEVTLQNADNPHAKCLPCLATFEL